MPRPQPIPLMEAALVRQLRAKAVRGGLDFEARLVVGAGVVLTRGQVRLGVWRWREGEFEFSRSVAGPALFKARTLLGAAAYTSSVVE